MIPSFSRKSTTVNTAANNQISEGVLLIRPSACRKSEIRLRSRHLKYVFCHGSPGAKNTSISASVRFCGKAAKLCAQLRCLGGKVTLVTFSTVSTAGFTAAVLCRKKLSWTGGKDSPVPVFPVKAAEAYRLGDVRFLDILAAGEVGAGERYLENPVVGTSGKSQLVEGGLQQ